MPAADLPTIEGLSGEALAAVARIWKKERRTLTARFGGSSMRPTLPPGAELTFVCGEPLHAGDVAVMLHRGRILVHRVVARSERGGFLLTRGDGTWLLDPPIAMEDAVGRVVGVSEGGSVRPPPPAPTSRWRRLVADLTLALLERSVRLGRVMIGVLWTARYALWLVPNALLRRARGRTPAAVQDQEQADPRQP
jgi:hypothetical protein